MTEREFRHGDEVEWETSQGTTQGTVEKKLTSRTHVKGHVVAATEHEPQYLVKSAKERGAGRPQARVAEEALLTRSQAAPRGTRRSCPACCRIPPRTRRLRCQRCGRRDGESWGPLPPLRERWVAEDELPRGRVRCTRTLAPVLGGPYLQLDVRWEFGLPGAGEGAGVYEERALIGAGADKQVHLWSFTSDGKHSEGVLADVRDLHPEAVGFEAQMPAGRARMA
jgi:hypothetical protein